MCSSDLKSVRLRAPTGEQVIFGNADLMRSRMRNLTRRWSRRVTMTLPVGPGTPAATLQRIPDLLAAEVANAPHATLVRAHLIAVTPTGFDFELVITLDTALAAAAFDARQRILLGILAQFEREGIALAQGAGATVVPRVDTEIR